MKVVQINATCGIGSTGKICVGISELLSEQGIENYILYSSKANGYELGIKCSNDLYIKLQALRSRILGNYGFNSSKATDRIIAELDRIKPDIVHLHNIHGHDCSLEKLFSYFKKSKMKLIWTFHDCWAFTGYCPHFTMTKCDKWQTGCNKCVQRRKYSWLFDRSSSVYNKKKDLFSGLDLTIVTPSHWLAGLVKKSFLKDYPVEVINNGIDLNVFKPTESDFKNRHDIEGKKIVLGVSFGWDERKGLDVFIELSKRLGDDYKVVLVGTDDETDKKLPNKILSIHRTNSQKELAEIYSAADVFVNPTREDTYPTVNIEAIACGTRVVTFKTGGSPEMLDNDSGRVVECNDVDAMEKEIRLICQNNTPLNKAKDFDKQNKFKEYTKLYGKAISPGTQEN